MLPENRLYCSESQANAEAATQNATTLRKKCEQGLRHMAAPCIISSYVGFISLITYERYSWLKARFILFLPPVARVNPV